MTNEEIKNFIKRTQATEAVPRNRQPKPTARQQILEASGRPTETAVRVHHISAFLKSPTEAQV